MYLIMSRSNLHPSRTHGAWELYASYLTLDDATRTIREAGLDGSCVQILRVDCLPVALPGNDQEAAQAMQCPTGLGAFVERLDGLRSMLYEMTLPRDFPSRPSGTEVITRQELLETVEMWFRELVTCLRKGKP
jgi:hypothetical protein